MATLEQTFFPIKNGTYTFSSTLDSIRNHTFSSTPTYSQGFLSKDKEADRAEKEFLAVNHFLEFIQRDIIEQNEDRHLYELVTERTHVRPYFDLEWDPAQLDESDTLVTCLGVIAAALQSCDVIGRGISIFCASGPCSTSKMASGQKASYHVLCDTVQVFRNTKEHGQFIKQAIMPRITDVLRYTNGKGLSSCVIDTQPYGSSQSFRLPYQSKWTSNESRPFLPFDVTVHQLIEANVWTIGVYQNVEQFIDVAIVPVVRPCSTIRCSASPEFDKVVALCALLPPTFLQQYTDAMNLIYCLWGMEQSDRMCNQIHRVCARATNYEYRWVQNLIRSWKYSAFTIGSLVKWATDASDKKTITSILKRHTIHYHNELFAYQMKPTHHTVIHQRYIEELSLVKDIVLKSHLGTGKTVAITKLIREGDFKRILIISPRKSYTYSQHGVFQNDPTLPSLESYLDHSGSLAFLPYLIVQAESLHRLSSTPAAYDLVIMDESESILCQMHSVVTHGSNMINNHEVLAKVVRSAKHVIFADAFISDRTFQFAVALRSNNLHYIENTFQPYIRRAIQLAPIHTDKRVANLGGFCERIITALKAGRKIVVLWTSKRRGEWFVRHFLKDTVYSHLFYNSGSDKAEQAGLKNVNETWRSVQCLMMTTSITVGISYDPKISEIEFDEAFLYASSASALPRDIAQSLLRVRVLKSNRLTYVLDTRSSGANKGSGFTAVWNQLHWKEEKQTKDHPLVKWTMCPDWAQYNHCYNINEERISRTEYSSVLQRYLTESGYTLCEEVHLPSEEVAALKVDIDNTDALIWDNIDDVAMDVAEEIVDAMKRGEATSEEIMCYKKANFRQQFVEGCTEDDLKGWWSTFYEVGYERRFWNIVKEKRWSITDVVRDEAGKRYGIMTTSAIKERETMERFLGIIGMKHSQEPAILCSERLAELAGPLEAAEKELREGMGLRKSERKGKWGVSHVMDLIEIILETWGGSTVDNVVNRKQIDGKRVREYTLKINVSNILWDSIQNYNVNYEDNMLKL